MTKEQKQMAADLKAQAEGEGVARPIEEVLPKKKKLVQEVIDLTRKRQEIDAKLKTLEEAKRAINEDLMAVLVSEDIKSTLAAGFRLTVAAGRQSKKLDPVLLIQRGVSAELIAECTTVTEGSPYLVVTAAK